METKGQILVVDDELGIRRGCQRALEPEGYAVETAVSLEEGLEKIRAGAFDLVLMDVMMPDGRGVDLLELIHAQDPEIIVIIITGYATVELAVEAIKRGAYDFISKPFTADLLRMAVSKGMERRRLSLETQRLQTIEAEAEELVRAKEEMERLSEFKSRFTFIVAHELRSPVGGAQSLLRTLTRGLAGDLSDKQREMLQRIEARLDQLQALIDDLLDLAASKTMAVDEPLSPVAPAGILQEMVERFAVEAEQKQIALQVEAPPADLCVLATEEGLGRVFGNLLSNAIKYTPPGGEVRVSAVSANEKAIAIRFTDSGIGIPDAALSRLGEEFFRAENARHSKAVGTGLGLSIVTQLLDSFGGSLDVESVEGKGSTFTVWLPRSR